MQALESVSLKRVTYTQPIPSFLKFKDCSLFYVEKFQDCFLVVNITVSQKIIKISKTYYRNWNDSENNTQIMLY